MSDAERTPDDGAVPPSGPRGRQPDGEAALRAEDAAAQRVAASGPLGTFLVAGVATAIVVAIYFLFYVFIYLPRGAVQ
jgi:hypothetical protein